MITTRAWLSLCQYLQLQPWADLNVLFQKHGLIEATRWFDEREFAHDLQISSNTLQHVIASAELAAVLSMLEEIVRTQASLRIRATPRSAYDERWRDLIGWLQKDGYHIENGELRLAEPAVARDRNQQFSSKGVSHQRDYSPSCFISYSTRDQNFAERLHTDLEAEGVRCWFAPHDVRGGRKLHEQLDEAIKTHERLLLILSEASINSEWVKTEIAKARVRELREGKRLLFPIRLLPFDRIRDWECFDADTGKDSAKESREYFIPDFSDWKIQESYRIAFRRLISDIRADGPAHYKMLSWQEFDLFRSSAVDPTPQGPVVRRDMNRHLSDNELRARLHERIAKSEPVYLLLSEYERRLVEHGIQRSIQSTRF